MRANNCFLVYRKHSPHITTFVLSGGPWSMTLLTSRDPESRSLWYQADKVKKWSRSGETAVVWCYHSHLKEHPSDSKPHRICAMQVAGPVFPELPVIQEMFHIPVFKCRIILWILGQLNKTSVEQSSPHVAILWPWPQLILAIYCNVLAYIPT